MERQACGGKVTACLTLDRFQHCDVMGAAVWVPLGGWGGGALTPFLWARQCTSPKLFKACLFLKYMFLKKLA